MIKKNNWSTYRTTNLLIGFITSISLCITAFNYTSYSNSFNKISTIIDIEEESVEVIRTPPPKPEQKVIPLPDKIEATDEILPIDEVVITEPELIPVDIDDNNDVVIDSSLFDIDNTITEPTLPPIAPPPTDLSQTSTAPPIVRFAQTMAYYGECSNIEGDASMKKSCSDRAFLEYLANNIKYPAIARENNMQGTVIVEIIIGTDGSLESSKIVRDISGGFGAEALRVINNMEQWSPAKQGGRPVRLIMNLPVKFKLQ